MKGSRIRFVVRVLVVVASVCILSASVCVASERTVPKSFTTFWKGMELKLKKRQYESFLSCAVWPQRAGFSAIFHTKEAFIENCQKYWAKDKWKTHTAYLDNNRNVNPADGKVIRVEYKDEDIMFELTQEEGSYKIVGIYSNLAGGD